MVHKITKVTAGYVVLMAVLVLTGRAGTWVLANGDRS